ncbi:hypothetical protein AB205_0073990, partial [Aquarana catesbeiana]
SQKQSQDLTSNLGVLEITRKELEKQVGSLKEQSQREATDLKTHLKEAENRVHSIQQEYADTQNKLSELKVTFEKTEQEKQTMVEELKQCKENLKLLQEKGNNKPWPWVTVMAALVAVTAVMLYPSLSKGSP